MLRRGSDANRRDTVRTVQEMLNFLGFRYEETGTHLPLAVDGDFGARTEHVVLNFQSSEGLLRDGIVGPQTMEALQRAWTQRQLELHSPGVDAVGGLPSGHVFARCEADHFVRTLGSDPGGYDRLRLRDDAAAAYERVREEVVRHGGLMTSSGGIRSLDVGGSGNRSPSSMHYLGRALDLYIFSGMVDPAGDAYVCSREESRRYRVFARCSKKNNTDAELPRLKRVRHVISYEPIEVDQTRDQARTVGVTKRDRFLDLTALFETHGFRPIRSRPQFEAGSSMMGAEWWHFQWEEGLVPGVSTFGSELLKVYSEDTLRRTPPWAHRARVWQLNWF